MWNPEESFEVKAEELFVKNKASPYVGEKLFGRVHQTYVGGRKVWDLKVGHVAKSSGALLLPSVGQIPTLNAQ